MSDPKLVEEIAEKTTFRNDIVEQVLAMLSVLKMISEDPILRTRYALIGGTAINLFNPAIPRLSIDLDFDYIHKNKTHFDQEVIGTHSDILERIADTLEMDYHRSTKKYSNRLGISLYYKSNFAPSGSGIVKLDISYLMQTTVLPPMFKKVIQLHPDDGFKNLRVLTVHPCELWAGKALALVYKSRNDPKPKEAADLYSMFIVRHLYDVFKREEKFRGDKEKLDQELLRTAFIIKAVARVKDLFLLRGEMLRRCTNREVMQQLYPFLREGEQPPLQAMKKHSRELLDKVCSNKWNKKQKLFVENFQEKGEYCPELLFGKNRPEFNHLYHSIYLKQAAEAMGK